jgi:hypothetical protein
MPVGIPGIDLREAEQLTLLEQFVGYYNNMPFSVNKTSGFRYYFDNPAYSYSDAILLYCMIMHLRPKRIVEIGSGFSSCAILDTNELFFSNSIETTFIEPHPDLLMSLVKEEDKSTMQVIPQRLQDVPLDVFAALEPHDILFVDSTHVSKVNSDVNRILFEILPSLPSGVRVHFHDIFYPFEYPMNWIYEGRAWNEIYILRAFLQYNERFVIELMNTYMEHFHRPFFERHMPLCLENFGGGCIWLRAR